MDGYFFDHRCVYLWEYFHFNWGCCVSQRSSGSPLSSEAGDAMIRRRRKPKTQEMIILLAVAEKRLILRVTPC